MVPLWPFDFDSEGERVSGSVLCGEVDASHVVGYTLWCASPLERYVRLVAELCTVRPGSEGAIFPR